MPYSEPVYIRTHKEGLLRKKVIEARQRLKDCRMCPRNCSVNRLADQRGVCKTGEKAKVYSYDPHFGEEAPLVGKNGSGTIFYSYCNLLCKFCQNYDISHLGEGQEVTDDQMAYMMLALQKEGCHNINFVTPSHVVPQILAAVEIAVEQGLKVPLVYNTSAYDTVETLQLLEGVIDIYMPDFKFWSSDVAVKMCHAKNYPEAARNAIIEMHRQVGDLVIDESGLAKRGILLRHLVMPEGLAGTREIMRFIVNEISPNTYVNIMSQYRPCGKAYEIESISRPITKEEYNTALKEAQEEGITRFDQRPGRIFAWL